MRLMTDVKSRDRHTVIDGDFLRRQAIEALETYAAPFTGAIRAVDRTTAPNEAKAPPNLKGSDLSFLSGSEKNGVTLLGRLGYLLVIVTGAGLGFGAVLASLHALQSLALR